MIRDVRANGKIVGNVISVKTEPEDTGNERKVVVTLAITDPELSGNILNGIDYVPMFTRTEKGERK